MASIRIVNLVKKYGSTEVVDHLSLEVEDGEFVTLLGPSGCGKTTTLRAIAGLVEIDAGEIYFGSRLMNAVPAHKRSTALVFQSYALFPHMTVHQNVEFGLRMRHVARPERARLVAEAMTMVGLDGLSDRRPARLSGGQQQRVALARAIATRPEVLLFDEPLSNLDAKLRERLRVEIRELQRRLKITSIYVTHDQAEAMVISDRIVIMNRGRIEQIGDPATIYRHPATSFTAEFIGQTNTVAATVASANADGCVLHTAIGPLSSTGHPVGAATDVLISWRPEDLVPYEPRHENRIEARVMSNLFMGNLSDVLVAVNGISLRVQRPGAAEWRAGDTIELGLPAASIQILR